MSQVTPLSESQAARSPSDLRSRLDFWQAVSGGILALFVCCHLLFDGTVVISPVITDWIGWVLEVTFIAQVAAPTILLLIIFHFWIAARKMPFMAGELQIFVNHASALNDFDTWIWLVQVVTGVVILVGAFFHVYTVMANLPIEVVKSAARLHMGYWIFFAFFMPSTVLHTGIGIYRICVKYGILNKERRIFWRGVIWAGIGFYLVLGTAALIRTWCVL